MQSDVVRAFIVGANLTSVIADIRRELGWKRRGLAVWEDDDGRRVFYLGSPSTLAEAPSGTLVYFASGYDQRDNWWDIDDAVRRHDCERVYL